MDRETCANSARWLLWLLKRNPLYLISAVLMSLGARLFLVDPAHRPGDFELIITTLVALQAYEWAVAVILVWLHRNGRSPEDQPSLLLVAILFWTGPMAAVIELTTLRTNMGVVAAIGVCAIAVGEMKFVERGLALHSSRAARWGGCACLFLLAAATPFLKVPEGGPGANELWLYGVWWVLAVIGLCGLITLRDSQRRAACSEPGVAPESRSGETVFLALVVGTTAIHVVGMSYAFYCHPAWFYASPLIISTFIVLTEFLSQRKADRRAFLFVNALPAVGILLATRPFPAQVPVHEMPHWLADPMPSISLFSAGAWWFSYLRQRSVLSWHLGSAAVAWTFHRTVSLLPVSAENISGPASVSVQSTVAICAFAATAYLALCAWIRRNRLEAVAAIVANFVAVAAFAWNRTHADGLIISVAAGWSWILAMYPAFRRPRAIALILPVVFLLVVTCAYDFNPALTWYARAHGLFMIAVGSGVAWHWKARRWIAWAFLSAYGGFLVCRGLGGLGNPWARAAILAAFAFLLVGAAVSWNKQKLLDWVAPRHQG